MDNDDSHCPTYSQLPNKNGRRSAHHKVPTNRLDPPRDPCSCIYISLVISGAGFLLPYNSFITAVDYYEDRFDGTSIIFDMSMTYIVMSFISVCINNSLVEVLPLSFRVTFGYFVAFAMLLVIALCDVWLQLFTKDVAYRMTLLAVAVIAVGSTVQQSSFYGFTSMLPRRYTQAVMAGESAAGLLVSINRALTKALLRDQRLNTMIFFIMSLVIVCLCCAIFHVSRKTNFVQFHMSMCELRVETDDRTGITSSIATREEVDFVDPPPINNSYGVLSIQSSSESLDPSTCTQRSGSTESIIVDSIQTEPEPMYTQSHVRKHLPLYIRIRHGLLVRLEVARVIWPYMVTIGMAYFVTLCLFPGIESEINNCDFGNWMPIMIMGLFNLFDFIGKIIASVPYDWQKARLVIGSACRIPIVPLMMMCVAPRVSPLLRGVGWPVILSILLGLTNGYFGSVPIILAPSKVPSEQKELTGNIMTMSYSLGLTLGSITAYILNAIPGKPIPYNCSWNDTLIYNQTNPMTFPTVL